MKIEDLPLASEVEVGEGDALLIVDVQNDFMPSGALPVEGGDEVVEPVNRLAWRIHERRVPIVLTQDWHPPGHLSFASSHGKRPYDPFEAEGIGPVLWPDHCVQGTFGADFHPSLEVKYANALIRKGYNPKIDSYSGFRENDGKTPTGLSGYLKSIGVKRILLCGLTLDYCVHYTALDGRELGFEAIVIVDLTRAVNSPPGYLSKALDAMDERGVQLTWSFNVKT